MKDGIDKVEKINKAIDRMDIEEIEKELEPLLEEHPFNYQVEDSKLFAKRIIKQNQKGRRTMKLNRKSKAMLVASLAVIIGGSVYATGVFSNYTIHKEDKTIEIKTDRSLNKEEVEQIANEVSSKYNQGQPNEGAILGEDYEKHYRGLEEVEKALNMKVVVPTYIPEEFKLTEDIKCQYFSEDNNNTYLTYISTQDKTKMLGVTIIKQVVEEGSLTVSVNDAVHEGEYTTPTGNKYTLYKETGEKPEQVAYIAKITRGDIEYAIIGVGIDETEFHKIIDSANLETYTK